MAESFKYSQARELDTKQLVPSDYHAEQLRNHTSVCENQTAFNQRNNKRKMYAQGIHSKSKAKYCEVKIAKVLFLTF